MWKRIATAFAFVFALGGAAEPQESCVGPWFSNAEMVALTATAQTDEFNRVHLCAQQGGPEAQNYLATMYDAGWGVEKDNVEALRWRRMAAEQGLPDAQLSLGYSYSQGRGVSEDDDEAFTWWLMAAEQGLAQAQDLLGQKYARLGNWREAARWIGLAAAQGYTPAYHLMGLFSENGYGVLEDWEEAAFWYEKSAVAGNPASQSNLGQMYEDGRGVPQDLVIAHMWFNIAAAQGWDSFRREQAEEMMTNSEIAEAQRLAREWLAAHPN